jgi:hypothetical protein
MESILNSVGFEPVGFCRFVTYGIHIEFSGI